MVGVVGEVLDLLARLLDLLADVLGGFTRLLRSGVDGILRFSRGAVDGILDSVFRFAHGVSPGSRIECSEVDRIPLPCISGARIKCSQNRPGPAPDERA